MRKIFVCLLTMVLITMIAGCNHGGSDIGADSTGNADSTKPAIQMDIAALKAEVLQQFEVEDSLDMPKDRLTDMYGFVQEDIKASACYITMGGAFVEEFILVECTDSAAADRIVQKLEVKLSDARSQAMNYDAQTYAMLEECKVQRNETYVALFICGNAPQMQQMFDKAVK